MALESSSSLVLVNRYKPVLPEGHGKGWLLPGGLVAGASPGVGSQGPLTASSPGQPQPLPPGELLGGGLRWDLWAGWSPAVRGWAVQPGQGMDVAELEMGAPATELRLN